MSEFHFRSITGEQIERISSNFVFVFVLRKPWLVLLAVFSINCSRVMALDICQNFISIWHLLNMAHYIIKRAAATQTRIVRSDSLTILVLVAASFSNNQTHHDFALYIAKHL